MGRRHHRGRRFAAPLGRIVAAYPTIPFLATAALEFVSPAGTPSPTLLAAGSVGLLAGLWFLEFVSLGLGFLTAASATVMLAFHPAMLRAAIAGPAETLVAVFLFTFGNALFDLRERGAAPEVMTVSLSLLGLAFSHPMGAAIACAAVPYLVFAVRPVLVANSAFNVVVALVFPTLFMIGAFTYVSWIFPGNGWSFYSAPSESLSAWAAGVSDLFGGGLTGSPPSTPVSPLLWPWCSARRWPLSPSASSDGGGRCWRLLAVLAATTVTAAAVSVATGLFGDPAAVAVAAPVLGAIVIIRIPAIRERAGQMLALLAIGWLGGALALALVDPRAVAQITAADAGAGNERLDALKLGNATIGRDGVPHRYRQCAGRRGRACRRARPAVAPPTRNSAWRSCCRASMRPISPCPIRKARPACRTGWCAAFRLYIATARRAFV